MVLCFAEAGSRVPTSGRVYGTVAQAFGPLAGFVSGMLTWTACVLGCGGVIGAFASIVGSVVPTLAGGWGRVLVVLLAVGFITLVNLRSVREAAWMVSATTLVKLVQLLLFVVAGTATPLFGAVPRPPAMPSPSGGLAGAVILGVFASSMETRLAAGGEVRDGHRNGAAPWSERWASCWCSTSPSSWSHNRCRVASSPAGPRP